jgi:cysteine sulfinate desulfinase/cysteine desulfurase-like protein
MRKEHDMTQAIAHSGVNNLLMMIESTEAKVKALHPGKKGRVLIANAKQAVDYEFGRDIEQMAWAVRYLQELNKIL